MVHVWTDRHTRAESVGRIREGGEGEERGGRGRGREEGEMGKWREQISGERGRVKSLEGKRNDEVEGKARDNNGR